MNRAKPQFSQALRDYRRVEKALEYLGAHAGEHPNLDEIARAVGLSPFHFQKLFERWAGISPKQFLSVLAFNEAKKRLNESKPLLEASLDSGLSGPGRLHDLFLKVEAMTPGDFKNQGAGLRIQYGFHPTPFGQCLIAATDRGICAFRFVTEENRPQELAGLMAEWPGAQFEKDQAGTAKRLQQVFRKKNQKLLIKGTPFQIKVWQALLDIPRGSIATYEAIAEHIGQPGAHRAVASAIAKNPVGYLIPCHRVIRKMGVTGGYRWGEARKKAILGWESGRRKLRPPL